MGRAANPSFSIPPAVPILREAKTTLITVAHPPLASEIPIAGPDRRESPPIPSKRRIGAAAPAHDSGGEEREPKRKRTEGSKVLFERLSDEEKVKIEDYIGRKTSSYPRFLIRQVRNITKYITSSHIHHNLEEWLKLMFPSDNPVDPIKLRYALFCHIEKLKLIVKNSPAGDVYYLEIYKALLIEAMKLSENLQGSWEQRDPVIPPPPPESVDAEPTIETDLLVDAAPNVVTPAVPPSLVRPTPSGARPADLINGKDSESPLEVLYMYNPDFWRRSPNPILSHPIMPERENKLQESASELLSSEPEFEDCSLESLPSNFSNPFNGDPATTVESKVTPPITNEFDWLFASASSPSSSKDALTEVRDSNSPTFFGSLPKTPEPVPAKLRSNLSLPKV